MLRILILAALLVVACEPAHPTKPTLVNRADPESPASICRAAQGAIDDRVHASVAALHGERVTYGTSPWTEPVLRKAITDSALGCLPFAHGAWIAEPGDELDVRSSLEITTAVRFRVVIDGRKLAPLSPNVHIGYGGESTTMRIQLASDYDGDGVPELWVRTDEDGVEGGHFASSWLLSPHGDRVGEYGPAQGLGLMDVPVDVDGDGRLDLQVDRGLSAVESLVCQGRPVTHPADLLAHALPNGTFSLTDEVADAHLRRWCPASPAQITTVDEALCARVRSTPDQLAAIRARAEASCVKWDCAREEQNKPQLPGADRDCNAILETLTF